MKQHVTPTALSVTLAGMFIAAAAWAQPVPLDVLARTAAPNVSYGGVGHLPMPKTILFSASPDSILADAEEWSRRGVQAFFLDYVAREWSDNIWAKDGKPWTIGESDETFQQVRRANELCKRIGSETFLKIAFDHYFEWFNDLAWQQAYHNFRQFALFARETGCTGMALDIEYVGKQYSFDWEGYDYQGYTRRELAEKIRERMLKVIQVLYDEFPDMVFLTFPEQGLSLGQIIHTAWIEEAARRNAPGGVHYCTEHTYRNPNIKYMFAYSSAIHQLFHRLLSDAAWRYWTHHCSIAIGVWPFGFDHQKVHSPGMTVEEFRQGFAGSLMLSRRYNWIYSHNCYEQIIGRGRDAYDGEAPLDDYLSVIRKKQMVIDAPYFVLAGDLQAATLIDHSEFLGAMPAISFAGPQDIPQMRLMPPQYTDTAVQQQAWDTALAYYRGGEIDVQALYGTQLRWMLLGPFPNPPDFQGHHAEYPPEQAINLDAEYDGVDGPTRWREFTQTGPRLSVDLTQAFATTEHVTAYALCYVENPQERQVQIRLGTNDAGKCWLNGALIYDFPHEGTAFLDRDIIPVTLPKGKNTILLKVSNGQLNWGFVFRITDDKGLPIGPTH